MIYLRVLTKPQPNDAKSPLPVDVRRSKTLLLKLPSLYHTEMTTETYVEKNDLGRSAVFPNIVKYFFSRWLVLTYTRRSIYYIRQQTNNH